MLNKYIFFNLQTGLSSYIAIPTYSGLYEDKQIYNDVIAVSAENVTETDDNILTTFHWTGTEIGKHLPKTNPIFIWDKATFSFIEPPNYLQIIKDQSTIDINILTSQTIYTKYPAHTQDNMSVRYLELMKLETTFSPTSQEALDIQSAWNWIKSVKNINHTTVALIQTALDILEIRKIEEDFKLQLAKV
jgi:hypothetical protein